MATRRDFHRKAQETGMTNLVLIASIAGERVAINAAIIDAVVDLWQVVPVPLASEHVIGIAAVRSRVLTVIDAAAAVGLRAKATGNRAIVIETGGHHYALRVDSIAEVVLPTGAVMPFEAQQSDNWRTVAIGTIDTPHGFCVLIDPAALIAGPLAEAA
jgi:purine-binding chemotaxis protein CheW